MLKGHVFTGQTFRSNMFALFINTFLNGQNGVSTNYKNNMGISYSGSTLTVQSGAVCIQGRLLEEDTSTDIATGTDNAYCKLVLEIDLDRKNTETEFVQASYKIIKGTNSYPELTQTNIVKNNSGIYQYELARFRTTSNGITDFQDTRTFLEFNSIYAEITKLFQDLKTNVQIGYTELLGQLQEELNNVENGSAYVLNTVQSNTYTIGREGDQNISGELTLTRQGRIVLGYLSLYLKNAATMSIQISEPSILNYGSKEKMFLHEPLLSLEHGRGTKSTIPKGTGMLTVGKEFVDIDIYTTQNECYFYKTFAYLTGEEEDA